MPASKQSHKTAFQSLSNQLLIAMPELAGSEFAGSVIYLCEHTAAGAMGLVVNNPLDIAATEIFEQLAIIPLEHESVEKVLAGGPLNIEHGFILHSNSNYSWESTLDLSSEISLTTSKDIVEDIAQGKGPKQALIILGYAGWGPGQLEQEIIENAWLTVPTKANLLFETAPSQLASLAASQAGIDLSKMSSITGHA